MANTHGSCLCGETQYDVSGPMRPVVSCHIYGADKGTCYELSDGLTAAPGADVGLTTVVP